MNAFILISISAFLQCSYSDSVGNGSSTTPEPQISDPVSGEIFEKYVQKSLVDSKFSEPQYVLLVSELGDVIIFNPETYGEESAFYEPSLSHKTVAIANKALYYIDKLKGIIKKCPLQDIVIRPENGIYWEHVGSFSNEKYSDRTVAVVDKNVIYFTTRRGIFYSYDTTSKTVTTLSNLEPNVYYNSMVKFDEGFFIAGDAPKDTFVHLKLDHKIWKKVEGFSQLDKEYTKHYPAMFINNDKVCCVGGDFKDRFSQYPVFCYDSDPDHLMWKNMSYSREARQNPGVAVTDFGIFIFGGSRNFENQNIVLLKTVEVYDPTSNEWSYIPTPPSMTPNYYSAIPFYFGI